MTVTSSPNESLDLDEFNALVGTAPARPLKGIYCPVCDEVALPHMHMHVQLHMGPLCHPECFGELECLRS